MKEEILRMEHIYAYVNTPSAIALNKKYALEDFSVNLFKGELLAVYGVPYSGIHELGHILSNADGADNRAWVEGNVWIDEQKINMNRNYYPERLGIHVLRDDNNIIPDLTVAENLFMGEKKNMFSLTVSAKKQEKLATTILQKFSLDIAVDKRGDELDYYEQIMVKMVRAYIKGAKILVINELLELTFYKPLRDKLFNVIRMLKKDGVAILWICQRIDYIKDEVDRILVVRNGHGVKNVYSDTYSNDLIFRLATESDFEKTRPRKYYQEDETAFQVDRLSSRRIQDISFLVKRKSVVGICTTDPWEQEELIRILNGEEQNFSGNMYLGGTAYSPANEMDALHKGVHYLDMVLWSKHGIGDLSVIDNQMLGHYWRRRKHFGYINTKMLKSQEIKYKLKHPHWPIQKWSHLSVEQQKILLYERCLDQPAKVHLIKEGFSHVGFQISKEMQDILELLLEQNRAVILLSMSYNDLCNYCDEIFLLKDGRFVERIIHDDFDKEIVFDK